MYALSSSGVGSLGVGISGSRFKGSIARTNPPAHSNQRLADSQSQLLHGAARSGETTFQSIAILTEYGDLLPASGLLAKHLGELIPNSSLLGLLHGRPPANFTLRPGPLLALPAPSALQRSHLDLPENYAQGILKHPRLYPRRTASAASACSIRSNRRRSTGGITQLPLVVPERSHSWMEGTQSHGDRDHRRVVLRPLAP